MQSTLGEFQETQSEQAFALQNSKLLKVSLDQVTIQAKAGSMVAYQGQVAFEHAGSGGMSRMLKKAVTGEGTKLMKMSGTGEVFLADTAQEVHLLYLENDAITVQRLESARVRRRHRLGHQEGRGRQRLRRRRPLQHGAPGHRLGRDRLRRPARPAEHRRRADVRRPVGRDHLGVERPDRDQDRHQDEELHRARLGRVDPDVVRGRRLGARPAERGARPRGRRRWRRRRSAQRHLTPGSFTSVREVLRYHGLYGRSELPRVCHRGHHLRQVDDPRDPRPRGGPQPLLRARALARRDQPAHAVAAARARSRSRASSSATPFRRCRRGSSTR